jgi:RNA-directed DNA polymerase
MGLFQWLKSWFVPRPRVRDIAGLTSDAVGGDGATRREVVDTSGQPLKSGGRRRALRDPRLLPKPKPSGSSWNRKKTKVMPRVEADRLFAETLRTRDRNIRDLLADVDQLRRYGLPLWTNEAELADALGLTIKQLRHYSIHRQRETTPHYVTFAIPKRSGGQRLIYAPKKRLKAIQRLLHAHLVSRLPVSSFAHGFRKGRSVATNAAAHVAKAVVIKLDIADCFPTIHFGRVRGLLIAYGYSYPVAQTLAVLMTEPPRQPVEVEGKIYHVPVGSRVCVQGAPTSPGLCNALLRRLDNRLAGLAKKHGFDYTRYADDLTFSGPSPDKIKLFVTIAARIAHEEGLPLNRKKTRVLRAGQRQCVTGVTVNKTAGLSRQERRRLRAALHQQRQKPGDSARARQLDGKLAYLRMLNPVQADALAKARRDA